MGNCFTKTSSSGKAAGGKVGSVLQKPMADVRSLFDLERKLGSGQFGTTYLCTERATGLKYACKSVSKRKLVRRADKDDMRREITILQHLSGQPNIAEFKGAFEDAKYVHVVMELCSGGDLFDRITAKGSYSERQAAAVCRDILTVVHVCHFMGVMHRDLKPENFLLASAAEDAELKAIDFGVSVFIEEGKVFKDVVGTAYYVAPEVLQQNYGKEIDVWSAGVILYILLCGTLPFWAETEKGIFDAILVGQLDFSSNPWPTISESAKDLIRKMLNRDPQKRITAAQALEHPWMKEGGASDRPIDSAVLSRMKQFKAMNKLKQLAFMVISENISLEELKGLKQMFNNMDTDKSGTITVEELKDGLTKLGSKISEAEVQKLLEAVDVDNSGSIDYTEFITAMMNKHKVEKEEDLLRAFQHFDKDNSGYITRDELEQAMAEYGMSGEANIKKVLDEVDKDKETEERANSDGRARRGRANPQIGARVQAEDEHELHSCTGARARIDELARTSACAVQNRAHACSGDNRALRTEADMFDGVVRGGEARPAASGDGDLLPLCFVSWGGLCPDGASSPTAATAEGGRMSPAMGAAARAVHRHIRSAGSFGSRGEWGNERVAAKHATCGWWRIARLAMRQRTAWHNSRQGRGRQQLDGPPSCLVPHPPSLCLVDSTFFAGRFAVVVGGSHD